MNWKECAWKRIRHLRGKTEETREISSVIYLRAEIWSLGVVVPRNGNSSRTRLGTMLSKVCFILADCTYHFLSCRGYAEGQWGILETGSRTPDLKGGLHTCPGPRVDISIVTLIATRERAWWNFLYSYCSLCSRAVLRCTPSPTLLRLLPKIKLGSYCSAFISSAFRVFRLPCLFYFL